MWRDPRAFCFRKQCKKPVRTEVIVSRLFEIRTAHDETLPAPAQDFPGIAPGCRASRQPAVRNKHEDAKLFRNRSVLRTARCESGNGPPAPAPRVGCEALS